MVTMSGGAVESFWIPNYDTDFRLADIPRKSSVITREFRHANSTQCQLPVLTVSRPPRKRVTVERRYITAATAGLTFDDDVIQEHCYLADSHFKTYRNHARHRSSSKRHKNNISYLNKPVDHFRYLKPVKTVKSGCALLEYVAGSGTSNESEPSDIPVHGSNKLSFQLKKCPSSGVDDIASSEEESAEAWDECVLMKLSANTARWLVQNPATTEDTRKRLHKILDAIHGRSTDNRVELVAENVRETDDVNVDAKIIKKSWLSGKDM